MDLGRGDIWWADLPQPEGSAPGYRRPVLVVQSDAFNRSRLATVTVVALTANLRLVDAPGNVLVSTRLSGLPRDSVANVSQVLTIDRSRLTQRVRRLPSRVVAQVDDGLRLALDL
ncbi:MAG: type II toxin-antitoxin system PemK/MazF family toxin [Gemmatimonadetes bacterium]|nr:type II toxin-antitoxin system PemK/MazF family toxin [Gemmatimonadota bacterium]